MEILDNERVHSFGLKAVFHNSYKNTNLPVKNTDNLMNRLKRNSGDCFSVLTIEFYQSEPLDFNLMRAMD
jgi:hypothetical protein